jgi:hypothetical protein
MVTRNDERVTCHLSGLDQRDRRASAEGILGDIKPRNGGNEFGISCALKPVIPSTRWSCIGMASASQKQVARAANGQFRPGVSGNLSGNVHRSRHALNSETIREMHLAFRRGGRKAIDHVMKQQPAVFLKLLVLLVPREMKVEHSGGVKAMTDEQIEQAIEAIQIMLAARAGEAAKVIEGTAEPAALPAPEAQSIGAGLEAKRQRRPNRLLIQADTAVGPRERISRRVPPPSRA